MVNPRTPQRREPRLHRARPVAPPLDVVAEAAEKLARSDPENPLVGYVRSRPEVASRLIRREALAYIDQYAPPGELEVLPVTARERAAAVLFRRGERTIRRWRTGR